MSGSTEDRVSLDGVITFFASHHAMRAERVLMAAGLAVTLVPGPRDLSPNCGVALAFAIRHREQAEGILRQARVQYEAIHPYRLPAPPPPDRKVARPGLLARWRRRPCV